MPEMKELLGKRMADLRNETGLSQAQVAEAINVAVETISRMERGLTIPSLKTLERIAAVLKVSLRDLFDFKAPVPKIHKTQKEKELAKVVALLSGRKEKEIRMAYAILREAFKAQDKL